MTYNARFDEIHVSNARHPSVNTLYTFSMCAMVAALPWAYAARVEDTAREVWPGMATMARPVVVAMDLA